MLTPRIDNRPYTPDEQVVSVVFGGQAGSEGKGAIVGFMARRHNFEAAICSFMTNAGHTWTDGNRKIVVQQLPVALVNKNIPHILIGPGSAITESQLEKEINELDAEWNVAGRLGIHPRAMIIEADDVAFEKEHLTYLGSTAKGCGAAIARKAMRTPNVRLARDVPWLRSFLKDTTALVGTIIEDGGSVMIEGSQGFDLDLHHGIEYPYCTSRSTTPQQTIADCGIAITDITDIIATLRTYPIRVGNPKNAEGEDIGYSGPFGGAELSWDDITRLSGSPTPLIERTTVTKRVRRIFQMDYERLQVMKRICDPNGIAVTFLDYVDNSIAGWTQAHAMNWFHDSETNEFPQKVEQFLGMLAKTLNEVRREPSKCMFLKTGPNDEHTISLDNRFLNLVCD